MQNLEKSPTRESLLNYFPQIDNNMMSTVVDVGTDLIDIVDNEIGSGSDSGSGSDKAVSCLIDNYNEQQFKLQNNKFVHPFLDMLERRATASEMINTLAAYCGKIEIGKDQYGREIYETVDQTEFIGPVLQVFAYTTTRSMTDVVRWLLDNFVPLQVSYDNNFCYFESLRWNHTTVADMLIEHESFNPTIDVLENLLTRKSYTQFKKCMSSAYILPSNPIGQYKYTFIHYIDLQDYNATHHLFTQIKQKISDPSTEITHMIYPISNMILETDIPTDTMILDSDIIPENIESL